METDNHFFDTFLGWGTSLKKIEKVATIVTVVEYVGLDISDEKLFWFA